MVTIMVAHNSKERDRFWEAYRASAEESRVRPDRSPLYVNWAKDFANFLPEKPLKQRSRKAWIRVEGSRSRTLLSPGHLEMFLLP